MANTYFVAPNGSDTNTGDIASPFATLQKAHDQVQAGDTIYLRGGTYKMPKDTTTFLSTDGTADNPIRLFAYQDEVPVLDASNWVRAKVPYDEATRRVIVQDGNAWHIKGIEMTGGARGFFVARSVSDSIWENLNVHHNDNSGFDVFGDNTNNNLILNSDFHHNFDPVDNGEDADGTGFKFGSGTGNVIRGSRFYNNSDDGIDLWQFRGAVTLENNWAYGNGFDRWNFGPDFTGNGMGFKLGGGRPEVPSAGHIVRNNLAWDNARRGFDSNGNAGAIEVENNTSFNNGDTGFYFTEAGASHRLRNNLSIGDGAVIGDDSDDAFNSWTTDVSVSNADFLSVDPSIAEGRRQRNGSLPESSFLQLAEGSDLVDAGIDIGRPFNGDAPDLGALEQSETAPIGSQPAVHLRFDKGAGRTAEDTSAQGRNPGQLLGETAWVTGVRNGAVEFDAVVEGVAIANSPDINLGIQDQRTISFWFNAESKNVTKRVLYEEGGGARGLNVYLDGGALFIGGWNRPASESNWSGTWLNTDQLSSNQWHHVAVVLEGQRTVHPNALTAYLDGEIIGQGPASQLWEHPGQIGVGKTRGQTRFHDGSPSSASRTFLGAIDELKIYNQSLNAEEVQTLASPMSEGQLVRADLGSSAAVSMPSDDLVLEPSSNSFVPSQREMQRDDFSQAEDILPPQQNKASVSETGANYFDSAAPPSLFGAASQDLSELNPFPALSDPSAVNCLGDELSTPECHRVGISTHSNF